MVGCENESGPVLHGQFARDALGHDSVESRLGPWRGAPDVVGRLVELQAEDALCLLLIDDVGDVNAPDEQQATFVLAHDIDRVSGLESTLAELAAGRVAQFLARVAVALELTPGRLRPSAHQ